MDDFLLVLDLDASFIDAPNSFVEFLVDERFILQYCRKRKCVMNFRYSERIEHYSGELFWSCSSFVLDGCVQAISFFGIGGVIFHASYLLPGALLIWTLVERKKNSLFLEAGSGTCLQIFASMYLV